TAMNKRARRLIGRCAAAPATPYAQDQLTTPALASTARVSKSGAVAVIGAIWTGFSIPISIGPITALPASSRSSLAERLADCRPGMTSTLAGADRRLNG